MEEMDQRTEQQVWKQVFDRPMQPRGDSLRELLMTASELAAGYRYLLGQVGERQKSRVRLLYEGETANAASLRGISFLRHEGEELLKLWAPAGASLGKLLETSYHRTRQAWVEYTARSGDPEFGIVFRKLAQREENYCLLLTELLGMKLR